MSSSVRFTIPFKGLSLGRHAFDFAIDSAFFAQFDTELVKEGSLQVEVTLNKLNNLLELDVSIGGMVTVMCDRCLDDFEMPVSCDTQLIVNFSEQPTDSEDEGGDVDVITLHPSDDVLDLSQYIYETVCLSLPIQKIHPDDEKGNSTCNKEMMEKLKHLLVQ